MSFVIEQIKGNDAGLYSLIGPLVMSTPVIRFNNNYPFKTSTKHNWFVAREESKVSGFIPVRVVDDNIRIDNYYVRNESSITLIRLIESIMQEYGREYKYTAVVHARHRDLFQKLGFLVKVEWKKYVKMDILPLDKKPVNEITVSRKTDEQTQRI